MQGTRMVMNSKRLSACASLVFAGLATFTLIQPADAAKRHHRRVLLRPAVLRPGYIGAPGFAGGPPGPVYPMLFDYPAPVGLFTGIPVLGDFGL